MRPRPISRIASDAALGLVVEIEQTPPAFEMPKRKVVVDRLMVTHALETTCQIKR